jgi:DNA-binding MarR family transcriptional regulator
MTRDGVKDAIADALAELQGAYEDRDRALADYLGVGRTDLRCLDLIVRHGPQTAARLGKQLRLTRGSVTTLIDRLERAGYAVRRDDPTHGKRKLIAPTPLLADRISPIVGARRTAGREELQAYSDDELRTILAFLQMTIDNQAGIRDFYRTLDGAGQMGPDRTTAETSAGDRRERNPGAADR